MDFHDSPSQQSLRLELRQWLTEQPLSATASKGFTALREWQARLHAAGWLGLSWPVEYGGKGLDLMAEVIVQEELARAKAPPLINIVGMNMVAPVLMEYGTAEQRRRFLPPILCAAEIWCQGFSEPGAGSDLAALTTRAEPVPGGFKVSGQKVWTSFGKVADWCFLLARTDSQASRHKGISAFLVEMRWPGVDVRPIRQITGESEFSELFLTDVLVPESHLVGEVNGGWAVAMAMLARERRMPNRGTDSQVDVVLAALLEDLSVGKLYLSEYDEQRLAECFVLAQIVHLNRYRNIGRYLGGEFRTAEGSVEKLFFDAAQQQVRTLAVELTGMAGLREGRWPTLLMRAMAETVAGGTTEVQKNIIAERLLGLPR